MPIEDAIAQALSKLDSGRSGPAGDVQVEDAADAVEDSDTLEVVDDEDFDDEDAADEDVDGNETVVELDEDSIVRIGGREGTVRDLLEMKADYTRKTQEIAEERKKVETRGAEVEQVYQQLSEYYTSRAGNPSEWISEIARASSDPTSVIAVVLKSLTDEGVFDPEFVKVFGLDVPENPVSRKATDRASDDRVAQLERKLQEREEREAAESEQHRLIQTYERQMENIATDENLEFKTVAEEQEFRIELLTFAKENDLFDNLEVAYAVMVRERARSGRQRAVEDQHAVARKRKAQVISRKGSNGAAPAQVEKVKGGDYETAARFALARMQSSS